MGREIRRVPRGWEHPRNERGEYQPLYDREFDVAAKQWKDGLAAWEAGEKSEDCEYWEWEDGPPDREYYRPRWTEEPTCFQMYETVSEGTPVSPVFENEEDLVQWLIRQGHSEHSARTFVEKKWAPSMIVSVPRDGSPARIASNLEAFDLLAEEG